MASVEAYTISVPETHIDRLAQKLSLSTFPDELQGAEWTYGAPLADIERLTAYWKEGFDWRKQEVKLNQMPNFRTSIHIDGFESIDLHFIHQKSQVEGAIPLLFCHGWPGSFLEVSKLLPLLSSGDNHSPAFHIVAPSIPNYGFSSAINKKGFGLAQYAETCNQLMQKLGYTKYVSQGGDWGCMITRIMGLLYPEHLKASHINMVRGSRPKWTSNPILALQHVITPYTDRENAGFSRTSWFLNEGSGYRMEQSTKPQTLGYALADSPVGLLAWIYEKLHDWTDEYPWTDDEILTWVSIYWFSTAGPAASLRIYYEAVHNTTLSRERTQQWIPLVKLGLAYFRKELTVVPKTWGRTMGPVVFESDNEKGGHFAAWEKPEVIVQDLRAMFGKGGGAYGVVEGKKGYATNRASL